MKLKHYVNSNRHHTQSCPCPPSPKPTRTPMSSSSESSEGSTSPMSNTYPKRNALYAWKSFAMSTAASGRSMKSLHALFADTLLAWTVLSHGSSAASSAQCAGLRCGGPRAPRGITGSKSRCLWEFAWITNILLDCCGVLMSMIGWFLMVRFASVVLFSSVRDRYSLVCFCRFVALRS